MLNEKDKGLLLLILNHTNRITQTTINITYEDFINDENIKDVSLFHILQIGELVKRLSDEFLTTYNGVPWKLIKGMRDIVVHGYETIMFEKVWQVSISDIPKLSVYCKEILNEK